MAGDALEVTVVGCTDLDSGHNLFDRLDAFVTLRYATQQFQTKVADDGGKNPKFGEKLSFVVGGPPHVLEVVVQDKDKLTQADFVGRAQVPFDSALEGQQEVDIPLKNASGVEEGSIQLILRILK